MCNPNSANLYPLTNLIHVPAIKLSIHQGDMGMPAGGVLAGTHYEHLREYWNSITAQGTQPQSPCLCPDNI